MSGVGKLLAGMYAGGRRKVHPCSRCGTPMSVVVVVRRIRGVPVCVGCVPIQGHGAAPPPHLACTTRRPDLEGRIRQLAAIVDDVRAHDWREEAVRVQGRPASVSDVPFRDHFDDRDGGPADDRDREE